jgi:multiple sugar transport system permease protein
MTRALSIRRTADALPGIAMFAPYLVLLVAFGILPIILTIATSVKPSAANPAGGLGNFAVVFQDFRFGPAVLNVTMFLIVFVPAMVILVAVMALLLDSISARWTVPLRAAFLVPASISGSVSILVWYFMLEPNFSPYRDALHALGITSGTQIWERGNLVWIFAAMAFATGAGNWIVVQYGSLQSIPEEVVEAARIDGANGIQIGLRIKLPMIRRYLVYMAILSFAAGLQVFVEPYLISSTVYPGLADNWSLNQLSYTFAFASADLGSAAALSLVLLVVCIVAAIFAVFKTDFFDDGVRTR